MPAKYKLTYFNGRGRCEPIRYCFAAANIPFDDVRITMEQWPALKPKTPMGAIPILEVDGKTIPQSMSILRFVARECNLVGKDNIEDAFIDAVGEAALEIREKHLIPLFFEKDEAKKLEEGKKFAEGPLPKTLGDLAKMLGTQNYFVGNKLSWADLMVFSVLEMLKTHFDQVVDAFPTLRALQKRVSENPGIAKYIKERPDSSF